MNLRPTLFDLTLLTIFANQQSHCAVQFSGLLSLTPSVLQISPRHAVLKHVSTREGIRIATYLLTLIIYILEDLCDAATVTGRVFVYFSKIALSSSSESVSQRAK